MENANENAVKVASPDDVLTAQQAADLAGMSRSSFLAHVGRNVVSDVKVGTRDCFKRATIEQWIRGREQNGVKKRGPKSQRERSAA